jgi:RNA polymerase sigma-70 factor (ECF subfamily)
MTPERERALVVRAREDGAAFSELYDFYLPRIHAFIYRRVRERSVAEDLTSMAFQRALENLRRADFRNDSFGGWLYRVAANAVVDHTRRGQRYVPLGDTIDQSGIDDLALDSFALALDRDQLRRALLSLPSQHRDLLVLRFYDDLDTDELCAVLNCSRETLAVRLHRALRALRMAVASESADVA